MPAKRRVRAAAVTGATIDPEAWPTRAFLSLADVLGRYHRHRVVNLERLGRLFRSGRRVLLVGNHALDIVDPLLLLATVFRKLHRAPCFIGHENGWFRVPVLRDISARFNVIPSRQPEQAVAALRRDGFLMLYPGSVREAGMRSYRDEPYRLKWEGRTGFLRVALDAEADVVFVAALGTTRPTISRLSRCPAHSLVWSTPATASATVACGSPSACSAPMWCRGCSRSRSA